jgi:N-methylhydantoinase B
MQPESTPGGPKDTEFIGPRLEVFRSTLTGVVDEMSVQLARAAHSVNIRTRHDFACALFDQDGRVVAQSAAIGQPGFVGAFAVYIPRVIQALQGEALEPGDHIVTNNPHLGMTHLPDVTVMTPLFNGEELIGFAASVAHHSDIGGWAAGGWVADARELLQEGIVINPMKLVVRGTLQTDLLRLICENTRTPEENLGDFKAQIAVGDIAQRRLSRVVDDLGVPRYRRGVEAMFAYARRRMVAAIGTLSVQSGTGESRLDAVDRASAPLIHADVRITDGRISIDLSGSSDQLDSPMNCTYAQAYTCAFYAVQALTDPTLSVNDGCYSVVELRARPGSIVDPTPAAAVSVGWETATRVTDAVLAALGGRDAARRVAESKGTMGVMGYGGRTSDGSPFAFFEAVGGGYGARGEIDGVDGVQAHVQNTADAQVEEVEAAHPLRITSIELAPDTEGAGRRRGGLGITKDVEFLTSGTWTAASDRRVFSPAGLDGGFSATPQRYELKLPGQTGWSEVPGRANMAVPAGTRVRITTPGGGGIGDPQTRDIAAVLADVVEDRITPERARTVYGVVMTMRDGAWIVDEQATSAARASPS